MSGENKETETPDDEPHSTRLLALTLVDGLVTDMRLYQRDKMRSLPYFCADFDQSRSSTCSLSGTCTVPAGHRGRPSVGQPCRSASSYWYQLPYPTVGMIGMAFRT